MRNSTSGIGFEQTWSNIWYEFNVHIWISARWKRWVPTVQKIRHLNFKVTNDLKDAYTNRDVPVIKAWLFDPLDLIGVVSKAKICLTKPMDTQLELECYR